MKRRIPKPGKVHSNPNPSTGPFFRIINGFPVPAEITADGATGILATIEKTGWPGSVLTDMHSNFRSGVPMWKWFEAFRSDRVQDMLEILLPRLGRDITPELYLEAAIYAFAGKHTDEQMKDIGATLIRRLPDAEEGLYLRI